MKKPSGYRVIICHPGYNEDVMVWRGPFRRDTLLLCVLKRKLDMAREQGLGAAAAYSVRDLGTGLVEEKYGKAIQFVVEPFYEAAV